MSRRGFSAGLLALGPLLALSLAACAHYAPAPQHPERFAATLDARRLEGAPASGSWTGAELLAQALVRNPQVTEARAKYATALAAVRVARTPAAPTLTLTAEYASQGPHWGYGGSGDFPLDFGTRRGSRVTTAELQALQAFYDLGEAAWSVRTDLEKARVALTAADAEIGMATQARDLRAERAERVEARVAAGQDARAVALLALGERATAERRLAEAGGRREAAITGLAKALGVSAPAMRDLKLATVPGASSLSELPAWRRDAASSRRDILRAVADYDLAEAALRLEIANQYPKVSLGPGYTYDHGVTKLPFSLSLALPGYDLNRGAIALAETTRAQAGRSLELAQANALAAVDRAAVALATARNGLERARTRDLPLAEKTADGVARSVRAGATDRVDDLAARGAVLDARLNVLDAERALALATADLEDALRRSFDPAETAVLQAATAKAGGMR